MKNALIPGFLGLLLGLVAGVAGGYYFANQNEPHPGKSSADSVEDGTKKELDAEEDSGPSMEEEKAAAQTGEPGSAEDIEKWTNAEILAELNALQEDTDMFSQFERMLALQKHIGKDQWASLVGESLKQNKSTGWDQMSYVLISLWAREDPQSAIRYAKTIENEGQRASATSSILMTWGGREPEDALAYVRKNLKGAERDQSIQTLISFLSQRDPQRAWTLLNDSSFESDSNYGNYLYASVLWQWCKKDPPSAIAAFEKLPREKKDENAIAQLANAYATNDPDAAWRWATGLDDPYMRSAALPPVINMIAQNDLDKAARLARELPAGQGQVNALSNIASAYASKDPEAGKAWVDTLEPGQARNSAVHTIASSLAREDPQEALEWLETFPGNVQESAISGVISHWAENDPLEASEYALSLDNRNARHNALHSSLYSWSQKEPQKTLDWLKENDQAVIDKEDGRSLLADFGGTTLSNWAQVEPKAAAEWIAEQEANDTTAMMAGQMINSWAYRDPNAAGEWINDLPDNNLRWTSIDTFANAIVGSDPQTAIAWATSLPDNYENRRYTISNVLSQWNRYDPKNARAWVESSDLSEEIKKEFLSEE